MVAVWSRLLPSQLHTEWFALIRGLSHAYSFKNHIWHPTPHTAASNYLFRTSALKSHFQVLQSLQQLDIPLRPVLNRGLTLAQGLTAMGNHAIYES
jgi:hypothetical protein